MTNALPAAMQEILNRMADNGCTLADLDAVAKAFERSRNIDVLDAWHEKSERHVAIKRDTANGPWVVFTMAGGWLELGRGRSADAARTAAARAIENELRGVHVTTDGFDLLKGAR